MNNRIILLGSKENNGKTDISIVSRHLKAQNNSLDVTNIFWEDLVFEIARARQSIVSLANRRDIGDADLVIAFNWYQGGTKSIYRDAALSLALYLKARAVKFWNHEMIMQRSISKLSTLMLLSINGYDVPHTYFSLSADNLDAINIEMPLIIKSATASRGRDNYLAKNKSEVANILHSKESINRYLVQEYIPNTNDLRIICMDSNPVMAIRRTRSDNKSHLNNTSKGASAEYVDVNELDPVIIQACRDICQKMGRNIAGIDLLPESDSTREVFLEVNAIPQLTTGTLVNEKMAALLKAITESEEGISK